MGMLWREEVAVPKVGIRRRANAVGIIQEDSDFNDEGFFYDDESEGLDDAEACPHIKPVDPASPRHSSR